MQADVVLVGIHNTWKIYNIFMNNHIKKKFHE